MAGSLTSSPTRAGEALCHDADLFVTVTNEDAKAAARQFESHGIETTPSGAAPLAAIFPSARSDGVAPGRINAVYVLNAKA